MTITTLTPSAVAFATALTRIAGAAPPISEAPAPVREERAFLLEAAAELGPWAGQARYSGPVTGTAREATAQGDLSGLGEGVLFSLGFAWTARFILGIRAGAMQIPGLSKQPGIWGVADNSMDSTYVGAFARWYVRPAGGVWLEVSGGAASPGFSGCCTTRQYLDGVPADEDALRSGLWGPGGSVGIGYAIHDATWFEWGPTLRAHGMYATSDHGRIMALGLTLGVAFGVTRGP